MVSASLSLCIAAAAAAPLLTPLLRLEVVGELAEWAPSCGGLLQSPEGEHVVDGVLDGALEVRGAATKVPEGEDVEDDVDDVVVGRKDPRRAKA